MQYAELLRRYGKRTARFEAGFGDGYGRIPFSSVKMDQWNQGGPGKRVGAGGNKVQKSQLSLVHLFFQGSTTRCTVMRDLYFADYHENVSGGVTWQSHVIKKPSSTSQSAPGILKNQLTIIFMYEVSTEKMISN